MRSHFVSNVSFQVYACVVAGLALSLAGGAFDCPCDNLVVGPLLDIRDAIRKAKEAGILTVVATGNDSYCWSIGAPACFSDALAVVASYDDAPYPAIINFAEYGASS